MNCLFRSAILASIAVLANTALAADRNIMAWGSKPTELAAQYVNSLRMGCVDAPADCIAAYKSTPNVKFISIAFGNAANPALTLERAKLYSTLSLQNKMLQEVGIDDFWAFLYKVQVPDKAKYVRELVSATKSENRNLRFGITLYENEIEKLQKAPENFPSDARNKIDRVALYLLYRSNWRNYRTYITQTRQLFPNAKIYGGVYHYDRRDYIACKQAEKGKCSDAEEISMFSDALKMQIKMLHNEEIDGLELYPGFLGNEQDWAGWKNQNLCPTQRFDGCIINSRSMSKETLQLLKE